MSVEIFHNPRCSKSRQTLQLLQEQGVEPDVVEYLKTPPDKTTLKRILKMLGLEPRQLMRTKEAEYKEQVPVGNPLGGNPQCPQGGPQQQQCANGLVETD